jgi:hypothetical protein
MKRLTVTVLLLLLCSCERLSKQKQPEAAAQPYRAPTAMELFDLQSKCTAMGENIMRESTIGNALTQEHVSHYNPKDNRCYVKLSISSADLRTPRENYENNDYLYDGQSKEMLAYVTRKGEKKNGMVLDSSLVKLMQEKKQPNTEPDYISDLIDSFVTTERRP